MSDIERYMHQAAVFTQKRRDDGRKFLIGAVGIRSDGVVVSARNSPAADRTPEVHAESRLCGKLTPDSVVYVVRVAKDGSFAMAKPCKACEIKLKAAGVRRAYFTNFLGQIDFISF